MLFDDIDRDWKGPADAGESYFGYLNRSGREAAARVRCLLEQWLSRYLANDRERLIGRLRSPDDDVHLSAFFELALHELVLSAGGRILAIEPKIEGSNRSPDFLAEDPDGRRFYLEAAIATGRSKEETGQQRRRSAALLAVESVRSDRHFLDVKIEGRAAAPPRLKAIRKALQRWVDGLPDGLAAKDVPPFAWEEHGLKLTISAFPRQRPVEGPDTRPVGMLWGEPYVGTPGDDLREAISKKASRYGKLDCPYVVAINSLKEFDDEEDTIAALFGSPCVVLRTYEDGSMEHFESRNWDGVWVAEDGPHKVGLSAVLSVNRLGPWSIRQRRACLIRNPWAEMPFPPFDFQSDSYTPDGDTLVKTTGRELREIYGLPEGWPGD